MVASDFRISGGDPAHIGDMRISGPGLEGRR